MVATYVDDSLHAGTKSYGKLRERTEQNFQCEKRYWDNIQFSGLQIGTKEDYFLIHQKPYIKKLEPLHPTYNHAHFRSL